MSLQTYKGNCHCGQYRFQIEQPEITSYLSCTCSYCSKQGYAFVTAENYQKLRGSLKEYRFASKSISFQFCETCGTPVQAMIGDRIAINARTITGLDIWGLKIHWYKDKTDVKTSYEPPTPMEHTLSPAEGEKIYTGACHCGAIKLAEKTKPLPEVEVKECDCSICIRNALIHFYPKNGNGQMQGEENLTTYSWGRKFAGHRFCKTCGVQTDAKLYGPPKEVVEKLTEERLARYKEFMSMRPVNIRVLDGVEWAGEVGEFMQAEGKVKVVRDHDDQDPPYVLGP